MHKQDCNEASKCTNNGGTMELVFLERDARMIGGGLGSLPHSHVGRQLSGDAEQDHGRSWKTDQGAEMVKADDEDSMVVVHAVEMDGGGVVRSTQSRCRSAEDCGDGTKPNGTWNSGIHVGAEDAFMQEQEPTPLARNCLRSSIVCENAAKSKVQLLESTTMWKQLMVENDENTRVEKQNPNAFMDVTWGTNGKTMHAVEDTDTCTQGTGQNAREQDMHNVDSTPGRESQAWIKPLYSKLDFCKETPVADDGDTRADEANLARLNMALVGRLFGRRIPFFFLQRELLRRWSAFGQFQLIQVSIDCFICIFNSTEIRDAVLMGGPWTTAGQIIGMSKWSLALSLTSFEGFSSPVWVRLPNLPLIYWDNINIARIVSKIGQPLWVDSQTNTWGRCMFARVCVRIDLSKSLPPGVWLQGLGERFFQRVEYEGLPIICFKCGRVGHRDKLCEANAKKKMVSMDNHFQETEDANLRHHDTVVRGNAQVHGKATSRNSSMHEVEEFGEHPNVKNDMALCSEEVHASILSLDSGEPRVILKSNSTVQASETEASNRYEDRGLGPWMLVTRRRKPQGPRRSALSMGR